MLLVGFLLVCCSGQFDNRMFLLMFSWFDVCRCFSWLNVFFKFSGHIPSCRFLVEVFSCWFKEQFGTQMRSASELPGLLCTMQSRGFTGEIRDLYPNML